MAAFYVYEHWRLDTDTCFYVGKGSGDRAYRRKSRNAHWRNIVAKLERTGSGYEIRMVATGLSEEDAFNLEIKRISYWRDIVDLANLTDGGDGVRGYVFTDADKEKIRQNTPVRRGEDHPMYGRKRPDTAERNKSTIYTQERREKCKTYGMLGKKNPNAIKAMRAALPEIVSDQSKFKMSIAAKKRAATIEGKLNSSLAGKKGAKVRWDKYRAEKLAKEQAADNPQS